jgi:hypothetical protein
VEQTHVRRHLLFPLVAYPARPDASGVESKLLTIGLRCGRLANRIVIFANLIALAEERKYRLINFTFHSYAPWFETTRRDIWCQYPLPARPGLVNSIPGLTPAIRATRLPYHTVRAASVLNEKFPIFGRKMITLRRLPGETVTSLTDPRLQQQMDRARAILVYDWRLRAPELVDRHAEKIRAYFRPTKEWDLASSQPVERLRQEADIVIGVHIRQGAYRRWNQGQFFFPPSRYAAWMQELKEQYHPLKVAFLICSDEPRRPEEFPGLTVGFGAESAMGDLYALSKCDCIIGPPSTFSQWASFYGKTPLLHTYSRDARVERQTFKVSGLGDIPGVTPQPS